MARVLVVGFSVVPGPDQHGVQLLHVVRALASRFTVDVLTLRVGELAYVERFQKTRMLRVPVSEGSLRARVDAFRRAVRRQLEGAEYDVVHFRDAWAGLPVMERRNALGYRTVFDVARSVHGDALFDELREGSARPRADEVPGGGRHGERAEPNPGGLAADLAHDEVVCWEQADLVLTGTEMGRRFLLQRMPPGRAERVVVTPPGVDVDRFDTEPTGPGGGDDVPEVLYAGPIAGGHGLRVLLRAFRDVVDRVPARLVLAGPLARDFMEPLGTALDQLALAPHVELLGAIDNEDMPRVISRATVCVAPAAAELVERPLASFPTKLLEYLACRRAVVAPRRSSVRELIQDGVEGLLFDAQRPRDLADKILLLLTDEPLRTRLAEAGQKRVRTRYPASALRRRVIEAYSTLLPPEAWNVVGAAHPRPQLAPAGLVARATTRDDAFLDDAGVLSDTSPALQGYDVGRGGDESDPGSATLITRMSIDETAPGAPLDDEAASPLEAEPWLVIAGDGSITRSALFGVVAEGEGAADTGETSSGVNRRADPGDRGGMPLDGLAPPPLPGSAGSPSSPSSPSGGRFLAGELEVRPPSRPGDTAAGAPDAGPPAAPPAIGHEGSYPFVAAGELLGPSAALEGPGARSAGRPGRSGSPPGAAAREVPES